MTLIFFLQLSFIIVRSLIWEIVRQYQPFVLSSPKLLTLFWICITNNNWNSKDQEIQNVNHVLLYSQAICADILCKKAKYVLIQEQGEKITQDLSHRERETVQQQLHHIGVQLDNLEKLGTDKQAKLREGLPERKVR